MDRRRFLRSSSLALSLPILESIRPILANESTGVPVKRLVTIGTYLGFHTPSFFPSEQGRDYKLTPILQSLAEHRDVVTLFSGLDHRAPNGHKHWKNYLTGKGAPGVSFDQIVAKEIGDQARYESIQVTCGSSGDGRMSYTKEGIALPAIGRPSVLYSKLFSSDSDKTRMEYILDSNRSVLDLVLDEARSLRRNVGARDAEKLDEYFSSVRDVEKKVQKQRKWLDIPTPRVEFDLPDYDPVAPDLSLECESIMYDLLVLALETDSTRVVSFMVPGQGQVFSINGEKLSAGYHGLSHHGNDPAKITEFNVVGAEHVNRFANFLTHLREKKDPCGRPVLDTTAILYGSGMGDANTHNNSRLPIILAGGPFKHGSYHAIDRDNPSDATPLLGDLFLTIMQSMGLEEDRFMKAKRNLNDYLL